MQEPVRLQERTQTFYVSAMKNLQAHQLPFLIGGGFAMNIHGNVARATKDLDLFCKPFDYPAILKSLDEAGFTIERTEIEWLAKIRNGEDFIDLIYSSRNRICTVDDLWFDHAVAGTLWDLEVLFIPPEEMIWQKLYVQERDRFDGADINHVILKHGPSLDWKRLLSRIGGHWEILLGALIHFHFVFPSEREKVPEWVMKECFARFQELISLQASNDRLCRGPLVAPSQYQIDFSEWGYRL